MRELPDWADWAANTGKGVTFTFTPEQRERIAEWVADLRSGGWVQGHERLALMGHLDRPAEYCCLGVACEHAADAGIMERSEIRQESGGGLKLGLGYQPPGIDYGQTEWSVLPPAVAEWLGFVGTYGDGRRFYVPDPWVRHPATDMGRDQMMDTPYSEWEGYIPLSWLNDHQWTFDDIATLIEREFLS